MTDYKMTDEKRKRLTELLGECWHEIKKVSICGEIPLYVCKKCGTASYILDNRTFTNDIDMLAVFRKIRDVGKFNDFLLYCAEQAEKEDVIYADTVFVWLFLDNPERACCLAAMFLEEHG
jgi:hypothetical protein